MWWLRRACEWIAASAMGFATIIATGAALTRNVFAYTPTWTEPVMVLLVMFAVALAVGPGLQDGVHVAIRIVADRLPDRQRQWLDRAVDGATVVLGLAICGSGYAYTQDLFTMGFTDFAGIPQWVQAAIASVFGSLLAIFAGASFIHPGSPRGPRQDDGPIG